VLPADTLAVDKRMGDKGIAVVGNSTTI